MKIRLGHLAILLVFFIITSCGNRFKKQKYTHYRSKVEKYQHSKPDDQQSKIYMDESTESDSTITSDEEIDLAASLKDDNQFQVRKIDWVLAYVNMLLGIASAFILIGVVPTIRGGFSFDRILDKTYVKRDRIHSIIGIVIAILGLLLMLSLTL
ncbi:MAG: hypothetical protein JKY54_11585 [Flavobacteriales bacterium]|nr:hypothetical protein [Flavobacteriales bacterium]